MYSHFAVVAKTVHVYLQFIAVATNSLSLPQCWVPLATLLSSGSGEVQFQDRVLEQKHDYNEKCVSHSRHYNIIVPVYSNNSGHVYTLIQHPLIVYTIISLH